MRLKSLLGVFLVGPVVAVPTLLPLGSNPTPGIKIGFDFQENRTAITLMGQQIQGKPVVFARNYFEGIRPSTKNFAQVGFLVSSGCPRPNFLADGKRVVPATVADHLPGKEVVSLETKQGVKGQDFIYNLYAPSEIRKIASAKIVRYEICDTKYDLAPQEQASLLQFLSKISAGNTAAPKILPESSDAITSYQY